MGWPKRAFNFYLESSIHVALAVTALTFMGFYAFGFEPIDSVLLFVFLGAITGYNAVKYAPIAGLYHRSLTRHLRAIQLFSFLVFIGLCCVFYQLPLVLMGISVGLGLGTLLYIVPFFGKKNLRNRYGLKIFIVGLVWAGVTVLLPYFSYEAAWQDDLLLNFIQRFLWVVVLTLPFDIRDLVYDSKELGTLPQRMGIGRTKVLGLVLVVVIVVLEGFKDYLDVHYILSQLVILIATSLLLLFAKTNQSRFYSTFWVEALPIFWLLLYWGMGYFFNS